MKIRKCGQHCGANAEVYAGGPNAWDWAGYYCEPCQKILRFVVFHRLDELDDHKSKEVAQ
jgi:hypothetical protein